IAHDDDAFARWEAANGYASRLLLDGYTAAQRGEEVLVPAGYIEALGKLLANERLDPALVALMLELPSEQYLFEALHDVDPALLSRVRTGVLQTLARELRGPLLATYQRLNDGEPYRLDADAVARRSLKNVCLSILA